MARALGSDKLLPSVLSAGDVVGTISSSPFASAGAVRSDAIVVAGGHDHSVGGWVVDRLVPGAVLDSMGTAEVVVAQSPSPPSRAPRQVDIAPGICSSGTTVLRVVELAHNVSWAAQDPAVAQWIRALIDGTAHPVAVLEAGYFRPGRLGDSPSYTLEAPRDPHAKASAVLGALAGAGRASVNAVCAGAVDSRLVRLAGGWARSPGWLEIKKTINGYDATTIPEPEVTAVGAAFLGATALGWEPDPARALGGASEIERGW